MAILLVMRGGIDARVTAGLLSQVDERIETVGNIASVHRCLVERSWSAVVLDAALPDGGVGEMVSMLGAARFAGAIAVLGAATDIAERVALLERGVDEYLALPYDPRELVARIRALVRRVQHCAGGPTDGIVRVGTLELDVAHLTIQIAGARAEHLTPTEARLLRYLITQPGRVVSHQEIWTHLLGVEAAQVSSNLVGVYMNRLRHKIEPRPERPRFIVTVRGRGYRFDVPNEPERFLTVAARGSA